MKILATSIASYLDKYSEKYSTDRVIVFFPDGTMTVWKSQRDYILGRIQGIKDVVRSSELNGKVFCNIHIYNNRELYAFINFEWGE